MIDFDEYFDSALSDERYLFHYTTQYTAMEKILYNQELKFSNSSGSHDPLERDRVNHSAESFATADRGVLDASLAEGLSYGDLVDQIRGHVKYACFSVDQETIELHPWDKGCFRSRMWSQYSDAHRGVCIVLSRDTLLERVDTYLRLIPGSWSLSGRVNYDDLVFSRNNIGHIRPADLTLTPQQRIRQFAPTYLLSKVTDYANESEFRIVLFDGEGSQSTLVDVAGAIEGIVLGQDFPGMYLPIIEQFSRRIGIPARQVSWSRGRPTFFSPLPS